MYGIDVGSGILRERSWKWLTVRISGLLSTPPKLFTEDGRVVHSTRLGMKLYPLGEPRTRK